MSSRTGCKHDASERTDWQNELHLIRDYFSKILIDRLERQGCIATFAIGSSDDAPGAWLTLLDEIAEAEAFSGKGRRIRASRLQRLKLNLIAEGIETYCLAIELPVTCLAQPGIANLVFCHIQKRGRPPVNVPIGFFFEDDLIVARGLDISAFAEAPLISTHLLDLLADEAPEIDQRRSAKLALNVLLADIET